MKHVQTFENFLNEAVNEAVKTEKDHLETIAAKISNIQSRYKDVVAELDNLKTVSNGLVNMYVGNSKNDLGVVPSDDKAKIARKIKQSLENAHYNISRNNIDSDIRNATSLSIELSRT
jgi:DnaJ-domain-containing protein 1